MKRLETLLIVAIIIALLGAFVTTMHNYIESERWAWYDAGYDDALNDLGIVYINGTMYIEDCRLGIDTRTQRGYNYPQEVNHDAH